MSSIASGSARGVPRTTAAPRFDAIVAAMGRGLVALTATPGQGLEEVQNVVKTLRIGRIDFRSDQDPDVSRYTHKREMVVERVQPDQAMTYV